MKFIHAVISTTTWHILISPLFFHLFLLLHHKENCTTMHIYTPNYPGFWQETKTLDTMDATCIENFYQWRKYFTDKTDHYFTLLKTNNWKEKKKKWKWAFFTFFFSRNNHKRPSLPTLLKGFDEEVSHGIRRELNRVPTQANFEIRISLNPPISLCLGKGACRDTVQQFDESQEAQLSVRVSNPVVKNDVERDRRTKPQFLIWWDTDSYLIQFWSTLYQRIGGNK